jgi:tetratricopeptide (TPR) repeat protein
MVVSMNAIFKWICFLLCLFFSFSCTDKKTEVINDLPEKYKGNAELQVINKKILDNPSVDSLYRERALLYLKLKDFELAEGDAYRALDLDTMNVKNYLFLSDLFYQTNQTRKAKETLERCLRNLPQDVEANLKMAELYYYVRKCEVSITHLNTVIKTDPYNSKAYFLKGMNFLELGDTTKAVSSFQTAVEQDDQYFKAYMQLARLYALQRNRLALSYFDNALRISPASTDALCGKSKFLQDAGMVKEAKEGYLRSLQVDSNCVEGAYNLGALVLKYDNTPAIAKVYFDRALIALSRFSEDGTFLVQDTLRVRVSYLSYSAYRFDVAKTIFARGVCSEKLKDKISAAKDYRMALRVYENFEPALSALNAMGNPPTN